MASSTKSRQTLSTEELSLAYEKTARARRLLMLPGRSAESEIDRVGRAFTELALGFPREDRVKSESAKNCMRTIRNFMNLPVEVETGWERWRGGACLKAEKLLRKRNFRNAFCDAVDELASYFRNELGRSYARKPKRRPPIFVFGPAAAYNATP